MTYNPSPNKKSSNLLNNFMIFVQNVPFFDLLLRDLKQSSCLINCEKVSNYIKKFTKNKKYDKN
jgi:hypothetical protein